MMKMRIVMHGHVNVCVSVDCDVVVVVVIDEIEERGTWV